jgi:exodeoxyribonuclease-3
LNAGGWTALSAWATWTRFATVYPDTVKYSWWSYRFSARKSNAGWRIDYFFVSDDIIRNGWVKDAFIDNDIFGSDHCPVGLILEM